MLLRFRLVLPFVEGGGADLVLLAQRLHGLATLEVAVQDGPALAVVESALSHGTRFKCEILFLFPLSNNILFSSFPFFIFYFFFFLLFFLSKKAGKAPVTFKCKDLPKDLFVEATTQSSQVRDIEIRIDYKNQHDKVRATAIWVDCPQSWHTRCPINEPSCDQALDNPLAGQGTLINLDAGGLKSTINTTRNSKDGSRYGHGYNGVVVDGNPKDDHFGGRILFEFSILPLLNNAEYVELGVEFDCTRRRRIREFSAIHGDKPIETDNEIFPFQLDDANDDQNSNNADEDNLPNNGLLYSWDSPGTTNIHTGDISKEFAFRALKMNFEEYVRL